MESQPFLSLEPDQVTPELIAIFNPGDPGFLRCQAVLEAQALGWVYTDHPETPTWVVAQDASYGTIYLAGEIGADLLHLLIDQRLSETDVLVGLWQDDPRWGLLPENPQYTGYTLEFTDREPSQSLPAIPEGCELRRLDHSLSKQILGRSWLIHTYGSVQRALEWGYGLCLVSGDQVLCEAFAGPEANGVIELGVETNPHHMQKGYATLTCSHLIHEMEQQGYQTYWNCATSNLASTALARRLGYTTEKEYKLLAWFKREQG